MADEEIVALLTEIRDLQKLHVENYKDALKNQQAGLEIQAKASRLQRRAMIVVVAIVIIGVVIAVLPALLSH